MARIYIICGHYGSGKSEYAINLALYLKESNEKVILADLDIVNPYFRSYEQSQLLEEKGIEVIVSSCGGQADIPAINARVMKVFENREYQAVIDIGGDPIGARVLARFAPYLEKEDFELLFVLNANRPETSTSEKALAYLRAIETESLQNVSGIVNNTHLCSETTAEEIRKGYELASELSEISGLPIFANAYNKKFINEVNDLPKGFQMNIYLRKPWEIDI